MYLKEMLGRYTLSTVFAVFITSVLLLIMQYAIKSDGVEIMPRSPGQYVDLLRRIVDVEPEVIKHELIKPKPPEKTPFVPRHHEPTVGGIGTGYTIQPPSNDQPIINPHGGVADGDLLPIMTVAPEYPNRPQARGIEGWVVLEFIVDQLGRVQEARVVEGQPAGVFDRSALRAVKRYKYKPRVVNGHATEVRGVRHRIVFQLS